MSLRIIPRSQQVTTSWSGGTTTQLFIYPENASYLDRNFLFRISTTTIEADESIFTKLPGISRKIMILEGTLKLEHIGKYTKILHPFESDSFEGDWETKGYGKVTDFNLMTRGSALGKFSNRLMSKNESIEYFSAIRSHFVGLYPFNGKLAVETEWQSLMLSEKDFLLLYPDENLRNLKITALMLTDLVIAMIHLPKKII